MKSAYLILLSAVIYSQSSGQCYSISSGGNAHNFSAASQDIEMALNNCNRPEIYDKTSTVHTMWLHCFRVCEKSLNGIKKLEFTSINSNSGKDQRDSAYNDIATTLYEECVGAFSDAVLSQSKIDELFRIDGERNSALYIFSHLLNSLAASGADAGANVLDAVKSFACYITLYPCDGNN